MAARTAAGCLLALLWLGLAGCITETEGGGPQVGDSGQRLRAQLSLAKGYLQAKDYNRARGALERALAIDRGAWEAHDLLASVHMMNGEPAAAEQSWRTAVRNGGGARARRNYASYLLSARRYDDACEQLAAAAAEQGYEFRWQVFADLGRCESARGRSAEALAAYERAIELNATNPDAVLAFAELLYAQGEYPGAQVAYQRYRSSGRPTSRSLWLGIRLARAQQDADAEASFSLMLRNEFPNSPEYRLYQESRP